MGRDRGSHRAKLEGEEIVEVGGRSWEEKGRKNLPMGERKNGRILTLGHYILLCPRFPTSKANNVTEKYGTSLPFLPFFTFAYALAYLLPYAPIPLEFLNYQELLFNDFGDRVAQLLLVESVVPFLPKNICSIQQQILIVNTDLLFPHDYTLCIVRLHQVYKILRSIESYKNEHKLDPLPIILCGDWNGSKRGHVYKFLRSQGFVSSYDVAHHYSDSDADAHKWVSHRNHRANICGVVLSRMPKMNCINISYLLIRQAALAEVNSFAFLKGDNPADSITFASFCQALRRLGLSGHPNGLVPKILKICGSKQMEPDQESMEVSKSSQCVCAKNQAFGFNVENAALFPPEVEKGMWPENYTLSDHSPLTVVFSPVKVSCSQSLC
ncbi:hypothetical protein KFK09_028201 [Dendrobium nobile]|uniref:Endonuclease/exonuclease/phosphatase domain-containing protein n=1 Tax=Dendrobium nobile TaxID=94219 RepID=A0A8T3A2I7_DENNO|nr:hypothetical protein KFK09_028201 [Dendrobium nobile]